MIKTVAAFMNTDGGTLLIGIDDNGQPVGVEADYPLVKGGDRDGWELWLTAAVKNALGAVRHGSVRTLLPAGRSDCRPNRRLRL